MGSTIGVILIITMFIIMFFTREKKKGGKTKWQIENSNGQTSI
jgi:spermidine/putrescine transport system permease protein